MKSFFSVKFLWLILLLQALLFSGCFFLPQKTATLWTNRPEFAYYVELFNAQQENYKIEVVYKSYPGLALETATRIPDLVAGENLRSISIIRYFDSLEKILEEGEIDASLFYSELLATTYFEEKCVLLPVSFNLPALMFREENHGDLDPFVLSLESIMEKSRSFNKKSSNRFRVMGFSPRWDPEILFIKSLLLGADFHETPQGDLAWDEEKLKETLDFIRLWIHDVNEGPEQELDFADKYMFDPNYKLVSLGRIGFSYTTLRDFFQIPSEKRRDIDFRWIAKNNKIPVLEDILFLGIPKQGYNKRAAKAFIKWFFNPETQSLLLEKTRERRLRIFGIADGFSSLQIINEMDFPRVYPAIIGHIPPANYLKFPSILPPEWKLIKEEVIKPYLLREAYRTETSEPLSRSLRVWLLQKPGKS